MGNVEPMISILTPVYNGGKYLRECMESVLAQTYSNYEYVIVNNCSTDDTLAIASEYARASERIRIVNNRHFVGAIENHNIAFGEMSAASRYCKMVSADDWIYPECVSRMVELAESNASVGVVQGYALNKNGVRSPRLPAERSVFEGREICDLFLRGSLEFCAAPSACLYRSSLVRAGKPFFPGASPSADAAAWLNCLEVSDLGVIHQVLSFERIHDGAATAEIEKLGSYLLDRVDLLREYGPRMLPRACFEDRLKVLLSDYYDMLATAAVNGKGAEFWKYHRRRLAQSGVRLWGGQFAGALCRKLTDLLLNPKQTVEKIVARTKGRSRDTVAPLHTEAHVVASRR
jgi:glycosyltransferase involved in cell wall biosynthesis